MEIRPHTRRSLCQLGMTLVVSSWLSASHVAAQTGLQITYGNNGLQTLSYGNVLLEDVSANSADSFHIWHMKSTDLSGALVNTGQYGWGEDNNGRSWDAQTKTWTYLFLWGKISVAYVQSGDTLNLVVTTTNNAGSGILFDGATIYPLVLHFPQTPLGFGGAYLQYSDNVSSPGVTLADFGSGEVVSVAPSAALPLFSGFQSAGNGNAYTPLISSTSPDGLASFSPHHDRTVAPGQTDTFSVSLRFAPSGSALGALAGDAYKSYATVYPPQLRWNDRRAIGTVYLASSNDSTDDTHSAGYVNNPRRYFNDSNALDFDIHTAKGLRQFQSRVLSQAVTNVANMKLLHAQGAITWDLEGEEYPQTTSYVCSPDQIGTIAPEMESIVDVPGSTYNGWKLDDAYFKTMTSAGLRVGVCIRPQIFTYGPQGTASQVTLPTAEVAANLLRKIGYAHRRWGATLFYIDSSVDGNGGTLDASIFQQVAAAFPDSLLIPEESTPRAYAYTAPFGSFLYHGSLGTDASVYNYYPYAFTANLVNDVDQGVLSGAQAQLTKQVKQGDVLMAHVDWWQQNNPVVDEIYAAAGPWSTLYSAPVLAPPPPIPAPKPLPPTVPKPAPSPTVPPVSSSVPSAPPTTGVATQLFLTYPNASSGLSFTAGQIVVLATSTLTLDSAGSYLMVDGTPYDGTRVTGGPLHYELDLSALKRGKHSLQLWAHDIGNLTWISQPVTILVTH